MRKIALAYAYHRSKFLGKIKEAFDNNGSLSNLLLDNFFKEKVSAGTFCFRNPVS